MQYILGTILALLGGWTMGRRAGGRGSRVNDTPNVDENAPLLVQWDALVAPEAIAAGIPVAFPRAWMAIESGGNVCAVGERTVTGRDNVIRDGGDVSKYRAEDLDAPAEVGLWQAYNPDDFQALGEHAADFVQYCVRPLAGGVNPQHVARSLTADEMIKHVLLGMKLIKLKKSVADHYLVASAVAWATDGPDYWSCVKAVHAWPPIVRVHLARVTQKLGRAPYSWTEFRTALEQLDTTARFHPERKVQFPLRRGLVNAEWVGFHVQPQARIA